METFTGEVDYDWLLTVIEVLHSGTASDIQLDSIEDFLSYIRRQCEKNWRD